MSRSRQARSRLRRRESFLVRVEHLEDRLPIGGLLTLPWADLSMGRLDTRTLSVRDVPGRRGEGSASIAQTLSSTRTRLGNDADALALLPSAPSSATAVVIAPGSPWASLATPATDTALLLWSANAAWQPLEASWVADPLALTAFLSEPRVPSSAARFLDEVAPLSPGRSADTGEGGVEWGSSGSPGGAEKAIPPAQALYGFSVNDTLWLAAQFQSGREQAAFVPLGGSEGPGTLDDPSTLECEVDANLTVNPSSNWSRATRVESSRVLARGVRYTLFVRGTFQTAPNLRADAEFVNFNAPRTDDQGVDVGLKLTGVTVVGRVWGDHYRPTHEYRIQVIGEGQRLGAWYLDTDRTNNSGTLSLGAGGTTCLPPDIPPD